MSERRTTLRRRVCLEGSLSNDLRRPAKPARVCNLSETGAELVLDEALPLSGTVAFSLARTADVIRQAEIVWQRDRHVGLRFANDAASNGQAQRFAGKA